MSPEKIEIDILQMELDKKLPHWLDPSQKNPEKFQAIRDRNRARWLAEQEKKRRQKRWQEAKARAEATLDRLRDFDPNQPRDEHGRWTDGGGSDGGAAAPAAVAGYQPGVKARNDADAVTKVKKDWIKASPITTIDQAIQLAPSVQQTLGNHGRDIAKELGGTSFEDPGPKTKSEKGIERVKEKAATRGISGVTDIARGAFVIDKPEKADTIVEQLSKDYEVLAEAWRTLPSNYTDRAVLIRDKSGMIGEIQIMDPTMWEAKKAAHALYEEARSLPPDSARAIELNNAMRVTFGRVLDNYPPEWKAAVGRGGKSVPNTRS